MESVIIVNPKSGKGKIVNYSEFIISNLEKKFGRITWLETEYAGHGEILAKKYGEHCDYMFVCGGDGTLNEVINGVLKNSKQPILAQIPCGTVNDFSSSLGIKKNIKKSVKQLLISSPQEVDIFKTNDRYGIYICGMGVFTQTSYTASQKKKNRFGVLSYFFNGLKEIKSYSPQSVKLKYNNASIDTKVCLMLLINSKSVGGFKFNKNAVLDDKLFDFVLVTTKYNKIKLRDIFLIARLFLYGIKSISKNKRVVVSKVSSIEISSNSNISLNFDGELVGENQNFRVEVTDKKLKFLGYKKS